MSPARTPGRRYHLKRILGEGAFGRVYLAEQESEGGFRRLVALKVLHADVARMKEAETRMRDEARVLGQLRHRNIVAVLDLVRLGRRWGIVMDYVPGVDLERLLVKGPVPPAAAFAIGAGVARALAAAGAAMDHDGNPMQVVHRDIKPSNVRLTSEAEVKVLDFGVARFSLEGREHQTKGVGFVGTERYMAPERILGQGDTSAGDVYATGATVVELLLGEPLGRTPALPNQHATLVEEALQRVEEGVPDDAPPAWHDAVAALTQSLAAAPGERPSAEELAEAWGSNLASLPGESLAAYAARLVPDLQSAAVQLHEQAEGVLEEGSRAESTMLDSDSEGSAGPPETGTLDRPAWTVGVVAFAMLFGGVGVAAFVVAILIAGGVVTLPSTPEPTPVPAVMAPKVEPLPRVEEPPAVDPEPTKPAVEPAPRPEPPRVTKPAPSPKPLAVRPRSGATVDKALFTLKNASGIWVDCGAVKARGTSSARIVTFPAGPCEVRANYLGVDYRSVVDVTAPRTVACRVDGEEMTCS